jgi:basic membrane protein A
MIIALVIIGIVFGSVGTLIFVANPYEPSEIAVVLMEPGFGDMSAADNIQEGMDELAGDISVQYHIPDELPTTAAEARAILEDLATSGRFDIIMAIGAEMAPAVQTVATNFPNQKFGMIGVDIDLDNVASAIFAREQSGFLGGVVAAFLASDYEGEIGILAARPDDVELLPMINGFTQGVEAANETYNLNVEITDIRYVNSWNNSALAQTLTTSMMNGVAGVDVLFAPVRASMPGVREGALAANTPPGRIPLIIAAEGNQDYFGAADPDIPIDPSMITCSVLARTDLAFYDIVNHTLWDLFPGGEVLEYDIMNGGVNITNFEYSSTYIDDDILEALLYFRNYIANNPGFVTP